MMLSTTTEYELLDKIKNLEKQIKNLHKSKEREFGLVWDDQKDKVREKVVEDCKKMLPILTSKDNLKYPDIVNGINNKDHVLIEGDNYHALSILSYTHKGKIDVIYIDPPYNTGNKDFIYNDRFVDKEDTYRHSKWLSFMESRLKLAKDLLSESGVIFISIDDNEQAQLKLLCDRIFGEENFIATLPTIMNLKGNQDEFGFAGTHEYTLVFCKNKFECKLNEFNINEDDLDKWEEDEIGLWKKGANLKATGTNSPRSKRPNLFYPIFISKNNLVSLSRRSIGDVEIFPITDEKEMSWRWSKSKVTKDNGDIIVVRNGNDISLYKKQRPEIGELPSKKPKTIFYKPEYSSGNGTSELKNIFEFKLFNNPKPVELVKDFIIIGSKKRSVILDFFAGSGTTGQAVLELNAEDNEKRKGSGNRQFILVTNNGDEKSEHKICEDITYPRLSKVINGYVNKKGEQVAGTGGNLKYIKADEKDFIPYTSDNIENLKEKFVQGCTEIICLKENSFRIIDDSYKIEKLKIYHNDKNYVAILFNLFYFDEFLEKIKKLTDKKVHIYIFSYTKNFSREEFYSVADSITFSVEPIPEKILETYKKIFRI